VGNNRNRLCQNGQAHIFVGKTFEIEWGATRFHQFSSAKKEKTMSIISIVLMWLFTFIVFVFFTRMPMGKESDKRTAYWSKYEGK
jgi:hypothetical protein